MVKKKSLRKLQKCSHVKICMSTEWKPVSKTKEDEKNVERKTFLTWTFSPLDIIMSILFNMKENKKYSCCYLFWLWNLYSFRWTYNVFSFPNILALTLCLRQHYLCHEQNDALSKIFNIVVCCRDGDQRHHHHDITLILICCLMVSIWIIKILFF